MKIASIFICLLIFTLPSKGQFVIDSIVSTEGMKVGECYARCVLIRDTNLAKQVKVEYIEPQYDTILEKIEVFSAYSYFTLRENARVESFFREETVSLIPAIIENIKVRKKVEME